MYSLVGTSPALPAMAAHKGKINGGTTELNSGLTGWSQEAAQDTLSVVRFLRHKSQARTRTVGTVELKIHTCTVRVHSRPFKGKGRKGGAKLKVPSKCSDYIHCEGQRRSTRPIEAVVFLDPQVSCLFFSRAHPSSCQVKDKGRGSEIRR